MVGAHTHIRAQLIALDHMTIEALAKEHMEAANGLLTLLDQADSDSDSEQDEPAEDDDPVEEDDPQGDCDEDEISTELSVRWQPRNAGCPISDPGGCQTDEREEDHADMGLIPDWSIDQRQTLLEAMVLASNREGMLHHCARL